jgi:hypothetical protein
LLGTKFLFLKHIFAIHRRLIIALCEMRRKENRHLWKNNKKIEQNQTQKSKFQNFQVDFAPVILSVNVKSRTMSEFDKLINSLKTKKDYNYRHVLRAAALNCRALQVDGQRDEPGDEVAAGREKISTLRDLCLRTVIQGIIKATLFTVNNYR